jgi:glycine/D-amino acid oxidase-like deaminating enzyme
MPQHASQVRIDRVPLRWRLRVAANLLSGIGLHDIRTAAIFVNRKFAGRPIALRWLLFIAWALKQLFHHIPTALQNVSTAPQISRTPMWLLDSNPLANHPWAKMPVAVLPAEADTVVIGAGFTGASMAYHWAKRAPMDRKLIVLDMDDPASGSSGRNEGVVVVGRYFKMVYDAVARHLPVPRPELDERQRHQLAWQFAEHYCRAAYHNAELIAQTIRAEGFDCDYTRAGWVQARESFEQDYLDESVRYAEASGFNDWQRLSPDEVRGRTGMQVDGAAGFSMGAASWHPAKWVWSLLGRALESGKVALFTRTRVARVESHLSGYIVHTERGPIRARHVVYATETYTPKLDSRLHGAILPIVEQAACGEGGPDAMEPYIAISSNWFFSGRYGKRIIFGSGGPQVPDEQAGINRPSRFLSSFVTGELFRFYGPYQLHWTNEWSGTTGYSPDEFPLVGSLDGAAHYMVGAMCGSGSGIAFNAARCITNRILGIMDEVDDYPIEYFAPSRLLDPKNHKWPAIGDYAPALEDLKS